MTQATYRHGHFVWHELMTSDAAGAEKFYGALLGWKFRPLDMGERGVYHLIDANGREVGGMFQARSEDGIPPHWVGYVSVPDVDAAAKTAAEKGGKVACAPMDIPNVGRFAYVVDPEGACFIVFRDNRGDSAPKEKPGVGDFVWDSLTAKDGEKALAFYGAVAGWTRGKFGDAPGLFFATGNGEVVADAEPPHDGSQCYWTTHVLVPNLNDARNKVESLGGKVLVPQIDVPNVGKMAIISDVQGAVISLYEPQERG